MTLSRKKLAVPVLCLILGSVNPATAQQKMPAAVGPIELGLFGQVDFLDKAMQTDRVGYGGGARLGYFFNSRWEFEGEASLSRAKPSAQRIQTGDVQINYYIGRLNYNFPIHSWMGILSAGAGANALDDHSDLILSPEVGLRIPVTDSWHVRVDASGMIAPNPTSATYKYPKPPPLTSFGATKNIDAAYLTNIQARLGVSWMPWGKPAVETVTVSVRVNQSALQLVCSASTVSAQLMASVTSNTRPNISQAVTWRALNPENATVDRNGLVTATHAGVARFEATSTAVPSAYGSTTVNVNGTTMTMARVDTTMVPRPAILIPALDTAIFFQTDSPKVVRNKKYTQERLNRLALRDTAQRTLDLWIQFLKEHPSVTLTVEGWADVRASDAHNLALSQRRADAAVEYLVEKGINKDRIRTVIPNGETEKFAPGMTAAALQKNRRAKVIITTASLSSAPEIVIKTIAGSCSPR